MGNVIANQYHLLRKDREITHKEGISKILKTGKYAIIALANNNEPYITTMNYGYDETNNRLYFHCALKGRKLDFINNNPNVCATIILDGGYIKDECEHRYSSLILRGELSVLADLEEKKHGLDVLLNHLEENPAPIKSRNIKNDESYNKVNILRLQILNIIGKEGK
jgi:uncharacterized protein